MSSLPWRVCTLFYFTVSISISVNVAAGGEFSSQEGFYSDCDGHKKCTHSLTDTIQLEFGTFPQFLPPGTGIYGQPFIGFRSVSIRSLHCTLQHHITYFILLPVVVTALLFHLTTTTRPVGIDSEFIIQSAPWPAHESIDWLSKTRMM